MPNPYSPQKNFLFVEQASCLFLRMLQNFTLNLFYNRSLYLAISQPIFKSVFTIELGQVLLKNQIVKLIVFAEKSEAILQWIPD
ncbi:MULTISPECIES: element excision factor XisH family protein [unclassified Microcoleus]|uniref:element excision factor XisH family protein n=1 Tax=unclassified Microcoleus TaxID=2642155 RepID=UPI002FD2F86C